MRKPLIAGIAGVIALAAAGIGYATIPGGDGVIHGCFAKSGGSLRVIDASVTNCKSGETALNWNQTGPSGPAGPAGATGPAGVSGYERVSSPGTTSDADPALGVLVFDHVNCPVGKKVVGGGGAISFNNPAGFGKAFLAVSTPSDDDTWLAEGISTGGLGAGNTFTVTARAICAFG
jgi:hypothetical protein